MLNFDIIKSEAKELFQKSVEARRHLHKNPELSFREFKTSEFIQHKLTDIGIPYRIMANTGVIGLIGKSGKCVALRADIDALPIEEETGLPFKSLNAGIMHACGHDMHTAMLLAAAEILKKYENELGGQVKLIFQPGEEKIPGGASILIDEGILKNPSVEAIFGQHIFPEAGTGTISLAAGPVMASADELYWTIKGKASHAAQPHLSRDPILAASNLINHYQTLMIKSKNPLNPGVLSVTSIHGGSATNIFPEEVKLMGTLRAYDNDWREKMHELIVETAEKICSLFGCTVEVEILKGYPPLVNDSELAGFTKQLSAKVLGEENTLIFEPKMWAEDFAFYAQKIPAVFWFLGVKSPEWVDMPPLHNPKIAPVEEAMINGIVMMAASAVEYLKTIDIA